LVITTSRTRKAGWRPPFVRVGERGADDEGQQRAGMQKVAYLC